MNRSLLAWLLLAVGNGGGSAEECVVGTDGVCIEQQQQQEQQADDSTAGLVVANEDEDADDPNAQLDSFGVPQDLSTKSAEAHFEKVQQYITDAVFRNESMASVRDECKNNNAQCTAWAAHGECEANPGYMITQCAPACFSCDQLDPSVRCAFDDSVPGVWEEPGTLNHFFENIVRTQPNVTVHSGPEDILQRLNRAAKTDPVAAVPDGPWIITMDNFLSAAECDHLIEQGELLGFKRSKGLLSGEDVEINSRTSSNNWCKDSCFEHAKTREIAHRVEQLTFPIPEINTEHWQLLKYTAGQRYTTHSDYIDHQRERAEGVRILTLFFYLNTAEGGGTNFPAVQNVTVKPLRGRAVLWPSVLNEAPHERDNRTNHQALPAVSTKYAANVWFHQRDYKTPYYRSCD